MTRRERKGKWREGRESAITERVRGEHLHNILYHSKSLRLAILDNRGPILLIQSLYFF